MTVISTMTLIEVGTTKILAGHDQSEESVFVFRRVGEDYALHQIGISEADQALRSILAADQSEHAELVRAILATADKPPRKPRRKRKAK